MFGIGMPELLLILALALIVIGPKKLPDIAKALGRGLGEFKKATEEFKNTINTEAQTSEAREELARARKLTPPGADPSMAASDTEASDASGEEVSPEKESGATAKPSDSETTEPPSANH